MSDHQWLHKDLGHGVVVTSSLEMLAVLRCAASLADKEGMHHTARRLANDADRIYQILEDHDQVTVIVR